MLGKNLDGLGPFNPAPETKTGSKEAFCAADAVCGESNHGQQFGNLLAGQLQTKSSLHCN
jgi:hypothetical protein